MRGGGTNLIKVRSCTLSLPTMVVLMAFTVSPFLIHLVVKHRNHIVQLCIFVFLDYIHPTHTHSLCLSILVRTYTDFHSISILLHSLTQTLSPNLNSYLDSELFTLKSNDNVVRTSQCHVYQNTQAHIDLSTDSSFSLLAFSYLAASKVKRPKVPE